MQATKLSLSLLLIAAWAPAQVLSPEEIRDPQMRELQRQHFNELKLITRAASGESFPYHFYFSRALDLSEKEQQRGDQRSIQFDRYQDRTVLKITGNYFAAYSVELMKPEERARQTYQDVMLPILRAAVPAMEKADVPQAFALEISHHVRKKVLGVSSEGVENVVLILPKASAQRLVAAADPKAQQAAILEGETFLNSVPIALWPRPEVEVAREKTPEKTAATAPPATPPRPSDSSPEALKGHQEAYQSSLDRMVQDIDSQAHFVRYAPPAFVPFHNGLYLQISVATTLPRTAAGSQYRLAALAFDQHLAHLIRPVLGYLKDRADFDGIDFSTSIRLATDPASEGSPVAVEFIFPISLLRSYAQFDCTGQQLIDGSFVLINGERVSLNLQIAEAGSHLE